MCFEGRALRVHAPRTARCRCWTPSYGAASGASTPTARRAMRSPCGGATGSTRCARSRAAPSPRVRASAGCTAHCRTLASLATTVCRIMSALRRGAISALLEVYERVHEEHVRGFGAVVAPSRSTLLTRSGLLACADTAAVTWTGPWDPAAALPHPRTTTLRPIIGMRRHLPPARTPPQARTPWSTACPSSCRRSRSMLGA